MIPQSRRGFLKATALAGLAALVNFSAADGEEDISPDSDESYSHEEVKRILGKRYDSLREIEKKRVGTYYHLSGTIFKYSYMHYVGADYSDPDRFHRRLSGEGEVDDVKLSSLGERTIEGYLHIYPWIKKETIRELDKPENLRNPDRLLLIATWYRQLNTSDFIFPDIRFSFEMPDIRFNNKRRRRR